MNDLNTLYSEDPPAWAKQMAALLKAGQFSELDIAHLVEELEGMGVSEQNELENRLTVLIAHLLKWQYQYRQLSERWREFEGRSWRYTIIEQRTRLAKRLRNSPGLKKFLERTIAEAYADAVELSCKDTGLPLETFPVSCPYSQVQILSDDYYPPME